MPKQTVDPDTFLTRLAACFESSKAAGVKGTVWLTQKRYTYNEDVEMADANEPAGEAGPSSHKEFDVLIRCTDGKDVNFSTRIAPSLLPSFHAQYGALLKASMATQMRKRDKKKEKAKAELKAKKRRELFEELDKSTSAAAVATGGKDKGKKLGHRQRQRRAIAHRKREAERARIEELEKKQFRSRQAGAAVAGS